MDSTTPHPFYPERRQAKLSSRAHFALAQLDADLSHPSLGPEISNQPKADLVGDFIDGLIAESQNHWDALLSNPFCSGMAKNNIPNGDDHFKWYMVQDMLYLKHYVYWELGFFSLAPWKEIQARTAGTRIQKDIGYVSDQVNTCVETLGVPEEKVLNAPTSKIIKKYSDYLIEGTQDEKEDWFSIHIMMLPCLLSYTAIATRLDQDPSTVKGTLFDLNWIQPNLGSSSTAAIYRQFLNDNVPKHSESKRAHWLKLFNKSIQMELDFWSASMTGIIA